MVTPFDDFNNSVFENSGHNIAEYIMKKTNVRPPGNLFNLRNDTVDDHDYSIRYLKKIDRPKKLGNRGSINSSSASTRSSGNFQGFLPPVSSTPYPPNGRLDIRERTGLKYPCAPEKDDTPGNNKLGTTKKKQNNRDSLQRRYSNVSIPGNAPPIEPKHGQTPTDCQEKSNNPRVTPTPEQSQVRDVLEDEMEKICGESRLKIKSVASINRSVTDDDDTLKAPTSIPPKSVVVDLTLDDSDEEERTLCNQAKPSESRKSQTPTARNAAPRMSSAPNQLESIMEDWESSENDQEENIANTSENPQEIQNKSRPHTIREPQDMVISTRDPRWRTLSCDQQTEHDVMSMQEDGIDETGHDRDSEDIPATLPEEEDAANKEVDNRAAQQPNDLSSGFVDVSSQVSQSVVPFRPNHPPIAEQRERSHITLPNRTSPKIAPCISSVFKAPPARITTIKRKRGKKIDSPLQRHIEMEKSIRTSVPRSLGTSKRKLYSLSSQIDDIAEASGTSSSSGSSNENFQPTDIEEIVDDFAPVINISHLPECQVLLDREDALVEAPEVNVLVETPKGPKKKKARRRQITEEVEHAEEVENAGEPLRRSTRTRRVAIRSGKSGPLPQLQVLSYNENASLSERYGKLGTDKTPDLRNHYLLQWEAKCITQRERKEKTRKKLPVTKVKPQAEKVVKEVAVVEQDEDVPIVEQEPEDVPVVEEMPREENVQRPTTGKDQDANKGVDNEQYLTIPGIPKYVNGRDLTISFVERHVDIAGMRLFAHVDDKDVGYLLFAPGTKKRPCKVKGKYFVLQIAEGSFRMKIDGNKLICSKNDIVKIYEGQKYSLTCLPPEGGKIFYNLVT